jgi:CRISPR-associated endoribonuclease Cas6
MQSMAQFHRVMAVFQTDGDLQPDARLLTAAILSKISAANPSLAANVHDGRDGYMYGKRIFKPLIHSQLMGQVWDREKRVITFPGGHAILYVGWRDDVVEAFKKGMHDHPGLQLGNFTARLINVADVPLVAPDNLSTGGPIAIWHNSKYVLHRNNPGLFLDLLKDNLRRKYTAIMGVPPDADPSFAFDSMSPAPMRWGEISILGNKGRLSIKGSSEMKKFVLAVGVGKYNTIGCGMLLPA